MLSNYKIAFHSAPRSDNPLFPSCLTCTSSWYASLSSKQGMLTHWMEESHVAIGTGFNTFFRGIGESNYLVQVQVSHWLFDFSGQVAGVAVASAIYQSKLDKELHSRITGPGAEEVFILAVAQASKLSFPTRSSPRSDIKLSLLLFFPPSFSVLRGMPTIIVWRLCLYMPPSRPSLLSLFACL